MNNRSYTRLYGFQLEINAINGDWLVKEICERALNEVFIFGEGWVAVKPFSWTCLQTHYLKEQPFDYTFIAL